jgi:hypothetical protein
MANNPAPPTLPQLFALFVSQTLRQPDPDTSLVCEMARRLDVNSLHGLRDLLNDLLARYRQLQTGSALIVPQYPQAGVVTYIDIVRLVNCVIYLNRVIEKVQLFINRADQA